MTPVDLLVSQRRALAEPAESFLEGKDGLVGVSEFQMWVTKQELRAISLACNSYSCPGPGPTGTHSIKQGWLSLYPLLPSTEGLLWACLSIPATNFPFLPPTRIPSPHLLNVLSFTLGLSCGHWEGLTSGLLATSYKSKFDFPTIFPYLRCVLVLLSSTIYRFSCPTVLVAGTSRPSLQGAYSYFLLTCTYTLL